MKIDRTTLKREAIPEYGDIFTMKHWLECVAEGCFIDYDGHGEYSDGKVLFSGVRVRPSDVKACRVDRSFSHVVWYNR